MLFAAIVTALCGVGWIALSYWTLRGECDSPQQYQTMIVSTPLTNQRSK